VHGNRCTNNLSCQSIQVRLSPHHIVRCTVNAAAEILAWRELIVVTGEEIDRLAAN